MMCIDGWAEGKGIILAQVRVQDLPIACRLIPSWWRLGRELIVVWFQSVVVNFIESQVIV